ncbi:hypothetical protein GCM10011513_20680 [Franconibacter daqui]|nr:hypothetical protein GCM10011513_20680 [Franconibacter daqui]
MLVALTSAQGLLAPYAFAVTSDYIIYAPQAEIPISSSFNLVHITQQGSATSSGGTALDIAQGVTLTTFDNDGSITTENGDINTTALFGLNNQGTIVTLDNAGSIKITGNNVNSSSNAINLTSTSNVGTLINSGTISGPESIYYDSNTGYTQGGGIANSGTLGTLKNELTGIISGRTGVNNSGNIDRLENAGKISSNNNNINGNYCCNSSAVIYNSGTINTLHNTGIITNATENSYVYSDSGIYNTYPGVINTLTNDGKISDAYYGIYNIGQIGTLTNNGEIKGGRYGILYDNYLNGNSIISSQNIINNGTISGYYGVSVYDSNSANTTTLVNNGTISGTRYAVNMSGNYGSSVIINNTGVIKGDIRSRNGATLEFINDSDKQSVLTGNGQVINLASVGDENTASGTESVGNITSAGDVIFRSGSVLLNDNIGFQELIVSSLSADSITPLESGSINTNGTVINDAARLQVNNPLTITGNYQQNAAASLILGVNDTAVAKGDKAADTGYGRLTVTGSANVDAGSTVSLARTGNTYQFAAGQRYVVIDANSTGTNYNADKLNYSAAGYNGQVTGSTYVDDTYSALVVTLTAAPTPPVVETPPVVGTPPVVETPPVVGTPPVVETPPTAPTTPVTKPGRATIRNATASLGGLSGYSGISPQLLELYNASLAIEGKKEANRVGERLSTGQNISASTASGVATSTAMSVVGTHLDTLRNPQTAGLSGVATGDAYNDWIVWARPYGGYARQDSSDDVSGYSAKFGGLLFGADRAVTDNWRVGAALNYSNTSVHGKDNLNGNTSTADNYGVIGYAGYSGEPWFVNLSAALTRQNYESVRRADFTGFSGAAHGKFDGQSVTLQSEFGYPFTLPADVVITPLASLAYGYQHVDDYKESGGNGMALNVGASHSQSVISDLGARVEKTFDTALGNLTPFAQLSWIHQYDNRRMSNTASYAADTLGETQFTTKGASPVEDMAGLSVGSALYNVSDLSIDARYDLQAGERYQAHTFSLRLNKSF